MAKVLFAWELGDGLGHVMRMLPLAERLREAGHECHFAVRNVPPCHRVVAGRGFPMHQAPKLFPEVPAHLRKKPMATFGDVITTVGFDDTDKLEAMVASWKALIRLVGADLIVCDYSPTAQLAAQGFCRSIAIGDSFTLPPPNLERFPEFRPSGPRFDEKRLLANIQEAQRRTGGPIPETVPSILAADRVFIITLPDLDSYGPQRLEPAVGPIAPLPEPTEQEPEEDFFCYLSLGFEATREALKGIVESGKSGRFFIRDTRSEERESLRRRGYHVYDSPPPLTEVVPRARLVIHHGGLGTSETVLALGRPQLLVPRHMEQTMNMYALAEMGLAGTMRPNGKFEASHMVQALNGLIGKAEMLRKAREKAAELKARGPLKSLDIITRAAEDLLADPIRPAA